MVKAKSHFQAGPVSQNTARSFTEDPEEQKDGVQELQSSAGSSSRFCRELGCVAVE